MRETQEIYDDMVANMPQELRANFTNTSKGSVWSMLFWSVAKVASDCERKMDEHIQAVRDILNSQVAHTIKWYALQALNYQDTNGEQPVKHASAVEENNGITIRIAGENENGQIVPLTAYADRVAAYINRIKDAGVKTTIYSGEGEFFRCTFTLFSDPEYTRSEVEAACRNAIKNYIENLPFDGVFTRMAAVDALQTVPGVQVIDDFHAYKEDGTTEITGLYITESGYFVYDETLIEIN